MKQHHSLKQQLLLVDLIKAEYRSTGYTTNKFAQHATNKLGFPVGYSQIQRGLEALEMEPNRAENKMDMGTAFGLLARVQALEEQVSKLAETIRKQHA